MMTDAQLAARWRRQLEVYDDLVYGYLLAEDERRAARERRRLWRRLLWRPAVWHRVRWRFWHTFPRLAEHFNERNREREAQRDRSTVALADLSGARHALSVPRFYPTSMLSEEHFRSSDPLDDAYAGRLEADLR